MLDHPDGGVMMQAVVLGRFRAVSREQVRRRYRCLAGVAALAVLPFGSASAQSECGEATNGTATCTAAGNPYPSGISYRPSKPLTLIINDDTVVSGPVQIVGSAGDLVVSEQGTIASSSYGFDALSLDSARDATVTGNGNITNTVVYGSGVRAQAGATGGNAVVVMGGASPLAGLGILGVDDSLIGAAFTGGNITTTGTNASGLVADAVIGSATASANTISTSGRSSEGIRVQASQEAAAGFSSVATHGDASVGVLAKSTLGSIVVRGGSVSTDGDSSNAIDARATPGNVDVAVSGPITTLGALSSGVFASSVQGDVRVQVTDVTTAGAGAYAVNAVGGTNATIIATGSLSTTGSGGVSATAASAQAGSGLAMIQVNNASTVDAGARGALASSLTGDASIIASGTIQTLGLGARGLDAQAFSGHAAITYSGPVSTIGDNATGVRAGGGLGTVISGNGDISTTGSNAAGIVANSTSGPTSVTAGAVSTTGSGSDGVRIAVVNSSAALSAARLTTTGDFADAAFVLAAKGATINVGTAGTSGNNAHAIFAQADDGALTITSGNASTTGTDSQAIFAVASGAVTVTSGTASSTRSPTIYLQSDTSTASLTVTGATTALQNAAVSVNATTAASLVVDAGGSISSGTNAAVISGTSTSISNAGTLTGGSGGAISAFGGPATIQNSGTINGRILTRDGDDRIFNSGTFNAVDGSDFGAGTDTFTNTGIVNAVPVSANPTSVTLNNLESFANQGKITLANGRVGDRFVLPGSYIGSGAASLAIDVTLGAAGMASDTLVIGGAATGTTRVDVAATGNGEIIATNRATIATGGGGSSPTAFVLAPGSLSVGFASYDIGYDPTTGAYTLGASPSSAARRPVRLMEGARNIWYMESEASAKHLRDVRAGGEGRLWGQAYGAVINRQDDRSIVVAGTASGDRLAYRQDFFGGQVGYDLVAPSGGQGVVIGATAGYLSSDLNFSTSGARGRYDSANAGIYAGVVAGPIFANVAATYDHHWLDYTDQQPVLRRKLQGNSVGVVGEAGVRIGGDSFYAEPVATIAYVHTDLDSFAAYSSTFDFQSGNGLRGKLGLRLASTLPSGDGAKMTLYASGNAVKEFDGRDRLFFTNNDVTYSFAGQRIGLYGEGTLGLRIATPGRVSGFIEGNGVYGSRRDGVRGGGGRVGINLAL